MSRPEFTQLALLSAWIEQGGSLERSVLIGLDLRGLGNLFLNRSVNELLCLGCKLDPEVTADLTHRGALAFPNLPGLPYKAFRASLYTIEELFCPDSFMENCRQAHIDAYSQTLDAQIYRHFCQNGRSRPTDILESLAQRLHDHSITEGIESLISGKQVVGIMGGHALLRTDPDYHDIALLARKLALEGFFMISGGGPGAMEACHLGVHFIDRSIDELKTAIGLLSQAPDFKAMNAWLKVGLEVKSAYPPPSAQRASSLGVPTWHFGHEPPNVFASHIGKYFSNSVREDGLVTIAMNGLIFAKGSAGTIQEIFQDQTQNYYITEGAISPMILMGEDFWKWRRPVYPLLCSLAAGKEYNNELYITDSKERIIEILKDYRRRQGPG